MNRDNTPWQPASKAKLAWQDDNTPYSTIFDDIYFSRENGPAESRHVFLSGNDLPARWDSHNADTFVIAETGFGTGLNFLLTWQAWRDHTASPARLHYIAFEKYPLAREDLSRALSNWLELATYSQELLSAYPPALRGQHRLVLDGGQLTLDLYIEDAKEALSNLAGREQPYVDASSLDGFAPARNEALWQTALVEDVARLTRPGGTLATFTAAGHIRRDLQAAGFTMEKFAGFGRKRESLRGRLGQPSVTASSAVTPWDIPDRAPVAPASALVLGAGLAGSQVAAALARRGLQVTVLDQAGVAGGGSGNEQGVLYTRLSRKHSALTDFALQSYLFAAAQYSGMFRQGALSTPRDGALCGTFNRIDDQRDLDYLREALTAVPELASVVDRAAAGTLTGVDMAGGGYWFPGSGWLHPGAICRALLTTPGIEIRANTGPLQLVAKGNKWLVSGASGIQASADCAVIATGSGACDHAPLAWLPLRPIRGQTTHLATDSALQSLRSVVCDEGYIAPPREGVHCIGATFDLDDPGTELRSEDHRRNLDTLARTVPVWQNVLQHVDHNSLTGRVGFRCASPDYLPVVGPVPARGEFLQTFAALRNNARQFIGSRGNYVPGLYVTTAHGSRGLSSTPLSAELLASTICGEPPPLSRTLTRALSPARFLIRDLARGKA